MKSLVRYNCELCHQHKWHVKVMLNPKRISLRVCRFCYRDLSERPNVKVVILWGRTRP